MRNKTLPDLRLGENNRLRGGYSDLVTLVLLLFSRNSILRITRFLYEYSRRQLYLIRFPDPSETGSAPDTRRSPTRPVASWESSAWPLHKQDVTDHLLCASPDRESVPEKFRFDDRDVLLHRINLIPAKWSPEFPSDANLDTYTPVNFPGYFTLTLLGETGPTQVYDFSGKRSTGAGLAGNLKRNKNRPVLYLPQG